MCRYPEKTGKLTLDEIEDTLRYAGQQWNGHYAILLNCSEATLGGNGCMELLDEPPGDEVCLYDLADTGELPSLCSGAPAGQILPNLRELMGRPGTEH